VISSAQRPLPDNPQHSQKTDIHVPGGIRTHNPNKRSAADSCIRACGHWDRRISVTYYLKKHSADKNRSNRRTSDIVIERNYLRRHVLPEESHGRSGKILFLFFIGFRTDWLVIKQILVYRHRHSVVVWSFAKFLFCIQILKIIFSHVSFLSGTLHTFSTKTYTDICFIYRNLLLVRLDETWSERQSTINKWVSWVFWWNYRGINQRISCCYSVHQGWKTVPRIWVHVFTKRISLIGLGCCRN
jgi:hypothetical protein